MNDIGRLIKKRQIKIKLKKGDRYDYDVEEKDIVSGKRVDDRIIVLYAKRPYIFPYSKF
jgi:hypothetical protein